jgi:RNA polymerase sporulation-specific sigma factor
MKPLKEILYDALHLNASDIHLTVGLPPVYRIDGELRPLEEDVDRSLLAAALQTLSDREKQIITMRFGLGGGEERTQKEVADHLGISQSYISRLEKRIISRLKKEILRLS